MCNDIGHLIRGLDPDKAQGHDKMSIYMLMICGDSISKPLALIFSTCLDHQIFPQNLKKAKLALNQ